MVISIEAENTFDKIKHPFMIKKKNNSRKTKNLRKLPQLDNGHLQITTANIIVNDK